MNNRRILFAIIFVLIFAIVIIAWFFFFASPKKDNTLGNPTDPFPSSSFPKKFLFILNNKEDIPPSDSMTEITLQKPQILTEIWSKPTTGQTYIENSDVIEIDATSTIGTTTISNKKLTRATSTVLLFVDKTTGYVYGYKREINKIYQISNTTIPGIHDAYIYNNGKNIILRYADTEKNVIVSVSATIPKVNEKEQAEPLESINNLPSQVTSVVVNKKKTLASYLVAGENSSSIYTLTPKGAVLVATSPFKEWSLSYGGDILFATSKPSAYVPGQTVHIPSFETIISDKTGLMSNPSENSIFLSSMWSSEGLKTFLTNASNQAVLNINTLASKCTWGQKDFLICAVPDIALKAEEGLPDDWFQGTVSFNDSFVTINPVTSEITPLYSFNTEKVGEFDVTNISLSKNNEYVVFNKKQKGSLWLLDTTLLGTE